MSNENGRYARGLETRREVLGDEHVDRSLRDATDFTGPAQAFVTAFGDSDPITGGLAAPLQKLIAGAGGQQHHTLQNAAHFCQEDAGAELAAIVARTARAAAT